VSAWKSRLRGLLSTHAREFARYRAAETASRVLYPKYVFSEYGRKWLEDGEFMADYRRLSPSNLRSADRKFMLRSLLALIDHVPGDTAECGVYEGACSYVICRYFSGSNRLHHAFDSFEGLSQPNLADGDYWRTGDLSVGEALARGNLAPFPNVRFYKGWIPETFSEVPANTSFALVHIDVDLYQPTLDSLRFFYPKLNRGALVICDDYGFTTCPGATAACDEFLADKGEKLVHVPTGQAFLVKR
jgi:O-methyltransferase